MANGLEGKFVFITGPPSHWRPEWNDDEPHDGETVEAGSPEPVPMQWC